MDNHFDEVKDFLRSSNADVIGLQEVKDDDASRDVIGFLESLGYASVFAPMEHVWDGKTYRFGPAIFSRLPIVSSEIVSLSSESPRVVVRADIQDRKKRLRVFCTHLLHTHQMPSIVQEAQAKRLLELVPATRAIVMGDFNATPESATIRLMRERLIDTDSDSSPTWSVYPEGCTGCLPPRLDIRLDYIFVTLDIKTSSFEVGDSRGSDHLPVSVEVE